MTVRIQANPDDREYADIDSAVRAKYSDKFRANLPGQIEHCLRLTLERLQGGLLKDAARPLTNPEAACLAQAANHLYEIYIDLQWVHRLNPLLILNGAQL